LQNKEWKPLLKKNPEGGWFGVKTTEEEGKKRGGIFQNSQRRGLAFCRSERDRKEKGNEHTEKERRAN